MKRILLLVTTLCLAPWTLAAQPALEQSWVVFESGTTAVYTDASPAVARSLLRGLGRLSLVLDAVGLGRRPEAAANAYRTTVFAFANDATLGSYTAAPADADVVNLGEYSVDGGRISMVLNAGEPLDGLEPWVHNVVLAQVLPRNRPALPFWLRHGLTQLLAEAKVEGSAAVRLGRPNGRHLEVLRAAEWIGLGALFELRPDSRFLEHGPSRQLFDAQSWLVAHYLISRELGTGRALEALSHGAEPKETLEQATGQDLETFGRQLEVYARGDSLRATTLDLPTRPADDSPATPVPAERISFELGRYLVRADRDDSGALARSHLEPLAANSGAPADALALLGALAQREGSISDAKKLFERALAAGPARAESYLAYVAFLAEGEDSADLRRELLGRALALDPLLADAWVALAEAHSGEDGAYAQHIARALGLEPERAPLAYNLAIAKLRQGDTESARRVASEHLRNPDHAGLTAELDRQIARFEILSASDKAVREGDLAGGIRGLKEALNREDDPDARSKLESAIASLERQARHNSQVEAFNEAVGLANEGENEAARQRLLELLPQVENPGIRSAVEALLEQLAGRP